MLTLHLSCEALNERDLVGILCISSLIVSLISNTACRSLDSKKIYHRQENVERNHKKLSKRRRKKAANFERNQFNEGRI